MPRLRGVPPRARAGLKKLIGLDSAAKDELLAALRAAKPAFDPDSLTAQLKARISSLNEEDLADVVETLTSLAYGRMRADMKVPDFVAAVVSLEELAIPENESDKVGRALEAYLITPSIAGTAKVTDVFTENERIFLSARIVTDLRPVFGDSAKEPPIGAAIVHLLKVSYHSALDDLDFYVAMDGGDLATLKDVIDRAEAKATTMKQLLEKAEVHYFEEAPGGE
jgi:hypothetical protein